MKRIEQKKKVHKTLLFTQDTYITIIFFIILKRIMLYIMREKVKTRKKVKINNEEKISG